MKTILIIITACVIHVNGVGQFIAGQAATVKEFFLPLAETDHGMHHGEIMNRDVGDIIVTDDFSDPSNWNLIALDGYPNWVIVTEEPEEISVYMGDMESTTEANGFGLLMEFSIYSKAPLQRKTRF